jgi:hypothetical protein
LALLGHSTVELGGRSGNLAWHAPTNDYRKTKFPCRKTRIAGIFQSKFVPTVAKDLRRKMRGWMSVEAGEHRLGRYLAALTHLEQCLSALWQAAELFNRMEQKVLGTASNNLTLYNKGDNSDLERINKLNNVAKHFSAIQAEQTSSPIWITNAGLKCAEASLSFDEIYDNLMALSEVARQTFVEIPREAGSGRSASTSLKTPLLLWRCCD